MKEYMIQNMGSRINDCKCVLTGKKLKYYGRVKMGYQVKITHVTPMATTKVGDTHYFQMTYLKEIQ